MADLAFLAPLALLFGGLGGTAWLLADSDTGWHIRTGEWILAHHRVPTQDLFSFSRPDGVWYAWEWLSDVFLAGLHDMGGMAAVLLASVLTLCVVFTLVFRLARRRSNPVVAVLVTLVAAAASSIHFLARPHLATLLFTVLFLGALERVRDGRGRVGRIPILALLPAGMALWTNVHGGFIVGILLVGAYAAGELLRMACAVSPAERADAGRKAVRYALATAACLGATLLNPYGWHLHVHVAQYLADPYQFDHINEFLSLNFHHPLAKFFELMLLAGAGACVWNLRRRSFIDPVVLVMWGHAALLAGRNIPIFMIVAAPAVARAAQAWITALEEAQEPRWLGRVARWFSVFAERVTAIDALPRWRVLPAALVAAVAALLFAPAPPERFRPDYNPKSFPVGAVDVLAARPEARIFSNDVWGGYLIYRLYPRTRVFIDGRSDYYGGEFSEQWLKALGVKHGWEGTLTRFGIDTILLPVDAPLAGALKETHRWRAVYDDGVAVVFRPSSAAGGTTLSATVSGGATGRDREVTKTRTRDRTITELKPKT